MALEVKEAKAGSRPSGGYPTTTPTLSPRNMALSSSFVRARPVRVGQKTGYNVAGKRSSNRNRYASDPIKLTPRSII